jgi:hypothetical protein
MAFVELGAGERVSLGARRNHFRQEDHAMRQHKSSKCGELEITLVILGTLGFPLASLAADTHVDGVQANKPLIELHSTVVWQQDFEGLPPGIGSLPHGWVDGLGSDFFGVADTIVG